MNKTKANNSEFRTSVIGVDLGSSMTKIAAVEKGVVDIITNEANLRQTPTIIGYGSKERLIGEAGNVKMKSNIANTIIAPNRYLGFTPSSYVQRENHFASATAKNIEEKIFFNVNCQGEEQKLIPEQVTAAFVTKISQIVELNKLSNKFMVFSIPNYLTQQERQALINSIEISKLSAKANYGIQLINESTAVGLDYGFYKKNEFPEKEEEGKNILFVDFGHSKLSLYVINFTKNYQKVIYQKHLRQMGCKQLDQHMFTFYANMFEQNNQLQIGVRESKRATLKLMENIEKQRKVLSGNSEYDFNIDCLLEDNDISYTMKREQFEQICQPVFQQIQEFFNFFQTSLSERNIKLSGIELIGGGSRIPAFVKSVHPFLGMEPSRTLNSNECIARGAGLSSAMSSGLFRMPFYHSVDTAESKIVCSWKGDQEEIQNEANQLVLYQENQTLFRSKTVQLCLDTTSCNINFTLAYDGIPDGLKSSISQFTLHFDESSEARKIKIAFDMDDSLMFNKVSAVEVKEQEKPVTIIGLTFFENLSIENLKQFERVERAQILKDIQILESYEKKNSFESQVYALKEKVELSMNSTLKEFINPNNYSSAMDYFAELENSFDDIENYNEKITEAQSKVKIFLTEAEQSKEKFRMIEAELGKLTEFVNQVVAGQIKGIKYYPEEDLENTKKWILTIKEQLKTRPKYAELPTNLEEISKVNNELKKSINECQAQQMRREKQQQQHYIPQQQRSFYQDPSEYSPFGSPHRAYNQRPRGRGRNTSFNGYNTGFFPGFSGFF